MGYLKYGPLARFLPASPENFGGSRAGGAIFLLLLTLLFVHLTARPSGAGARTRVDDSALEIGEFQGKLPLGQHAYIADIPRAYLDEWFTSPGDVLSRLIVDIPESAPLRTLSGRSGMALDLRRHAKDKLFLDAPSQLSLVVVDLIYTGPGKADFLIDMSHVDGIAWQYRDPEGRVIRHADDFGELMGGKPVIDTRAIIPLEMEAGHRYRLYVTAYTITAARHAWMDLWNEEELRAERWQLRFLDGGYFGLIIAMILYNLFLFAALRQYPYLYFALFVAASAAEIAIASGMALIFTPYPASLPLAFLFQGLVEVFGALFTMSLLNIRETNRVLFYLWNAVAILSAVTTAVVVYIAIASNGGFSTASINSTLYIAALVWIIYQFANVCTLVYYWRESTIARYWFLGITIHTWALALYPILLDTATDPILDPYRYAQLATVFDTILLSVLIAFNVRSEHGMRIQAEHKAVENLRLAHDLERARSNFIATVGHDLRGPVQAISHFTQSLKHQLPEASRNEVNKIDKNLTAISELLDSMIKLSQTEWQAMNPVLEEVSLSLLLSELRSEFTTKAAEKDLLLKFDYARCSVRSDRVSLSQILRNIIGNAIKYTDEGYVRVVVEEELNSVTVAVEDTGRGIPDNELSRIFDEFYQVGGGGGDSTGVGLGLSIVARLTKVLGIKMTVRSRYGVGSRFELKIERALTGTEIGTPVSSEPVQDDQPKPGSLTGLAVLVISDKDGIMDNLGEQLISWGADIHQLPSFHEAIEHLEEDPSKPDLMLVDLVFYEMLEITFNPEEVERMLGVDVPVLIVIQDGEDFPQDRVLRKNHTVIRVPMEPMRFRSLIQHHVGLPATML